MQVARTYDVALICPIFETEGPGSFYNSTVIIDAGGNSGKLPKIHVPDPSLGGNTLFSRNLGFGL
jgi:predicted amidohydrolase